MDLKQFLKKYKNEHNNSLNKSLKDIVHDDRSATEILPEYLNYLLKEKERILAKGRSQLLFIEPLDNFFNDISKLDSNNPKVLKDIAKLYKDLLKMDVMDVNVFIINRDPNLGYKEICIKSGDVELFEIVNSNSANEKYEMSSIMWDGNYAKIIKKEIIKESFYRNRKLFDYINNKYPDMVKQSSSNGIIREVLKKNDLENFNFIVNNTNWNYDSSNWITSLFEAAAETNNPSIYEIYLASQNMSTFEAKKMMLKAIDNNNSDLFIKTYEKGGYKYFKSAKSFEDIINNEEISSEIKEQIERYFAMYKDFGSIIITYDQIPDEEKHEKTARLYEIIHSGIMNFDYKFGDLDNRKYRMGGSVYDLLTEAQTLPVEIYSFFYERIINQYKKEDYSDYTVRKDIDNIIRKIIQSDNLDQYKYFTKITENKFNENIISTNHINRSIYKETLNIFNYLYNIYKDKENFSEIFNFELLKECISIIDHIIKEYAQENVEKAGENQDYSNTVNFFKLKETLYNDYKNNLNELAEKSPYLKSLLKEKENILEITKEEIINARYDSDDINYYNEIVKQKYPDKKEKERAKYLLLDAVRDNKENLNNYILENTLNLDKDTLSFLFKTNNVDLLKKIFQHKKPEQNIEYIHTVTGASWGYREWQNVPDTKEKREINIYMLALKDSENYEEIFNLLDEAGYVRSSNLENKIEEIKKEEEKRKIIEEKRKKEEEAKSPKQKENEFLIANMINNKEAIINYINEKGIDNLDLEEEISIDKENGPKCENLLDFAVKSDNVTLTKMIINKYNLNKTKKKIEIKYDENDKVKKINIIKDEKNYLHFNSRSPEMLEVLVKNGFNINEEKNGYNLIEKHISEASYGSIKYNLVTKAVELGLDITKKTKYYGKRSKVYYNTILDTQLAESTQSDGEDMFEAIIKGIDEKDKINAMVDIYNSSSKFLRKRNELKETIISYIKRFGRSDNFDKTIAKLNIIVSSYQKNEKNHSNLGNEFLDTFKSAIENLKERKKQWIEARAKRKEEETLIANEISRMKRAYEKRIENQSFEEDEKQV